MTSREPTPKISSGSRMDINAPTSNVQHHKALCSVMIEKRLMSLEGISNADLDLGPT